MDLNEEMKKDLADRSPGSFTAFLDAGLQHGIAKGEISEEEAKALLDLAKLFDR